MTTTTKSPIIDSKNPHDKIDDTSSGTVMTNVATLELDDVITSNEQVMSPRSPKRLSVIKSGSRHNTSPRTNFIEKRMKSLRKTKDDSVLKGLRSDLGSITSYLESLSKEPEAAFKGLVEHILNYLVKLQTILSENSLDSINSTINVMLLQRKCTSILQSDQLNLEKMHEYAAYFFDQFVSTVDLIEPDKTNDAILKKKLVILKTCADKYKDFCQRVQNEIKPSQSKFPTPQKTKDVYSTPKRTASVPNDLTKDHIAPTGNAQRRSKRKLSLNKKTERSLSLQNGLNSTSHLKKTNPSNLRDRMLQKSQSYGSFFGSGFQDLKALKHALFATEMLGIDNVDRLLVEASVEDLTPTLLGQISKFPNSVQVLKDYLKSQLKFADENPFIQRINSLDFSNDVLRKISLPQALEIISKDIDLVIQLSLSEQIDNLSIDSELKDKLSGVINNFEGYLTKLRGVIAKVAIKMNEQSSDELQAGRARSLDEQLNQTALIQKMVNGGTKSF